jgi:phosphocarrier protein
LEKEFIIRNRLGLHLRAAAQFVKVANRFECNIHVEREGTTVNGKSIMGLAMLAAARGSRIVVIAEGRDATEAIEALGALIDSKFGEE